MEAGKKSLRFLVITPLLVLALLGFGILRMLALTEKPFPGVPYVTVKAYLYRLDNQLTEKNGQMYEPSATDFISKGVLSSTVVNKDGAVLSPKQIHILLRSISISSTSIIRPNCAFNPHHAFVFYDAANKPVGTIAICTMCEDVETDPPLPNVEYNYDFDALDTLLKQLHLPVFLNEDDLIAYRDSLKKNSRYGKDGD